MRALTDAELQIVGGAGGWKHGHHKKFAKLEVAVAVATNDSDIDQNITLDHSYIIVKGANKGGVNFVQSASVEQEANATAST